MTALRGLRESHPEMGAEELQRLNNQVLIMIAEYHLTSASQGTHHILPVLPEGAARHLLWTSYRSESPWLHGKGARTTLGGITISESQPRKRDAAAAGVQGATLKRRLDTRRRELHQPGAYLPVGGAPGLGATSGASHGSRSPRCYR